MGRWVDSGATWGSSGSLGFFMFIEPPSLGGFVYMISYVAPMGSWSAFMIFGFIRARPGSVRVHLGSLCTLVRALGVVCSFRFFFFFPGVVGFIRVLSPWRSSIYFGRALGIVVFIRERSGDRRFHSGCGLGVVIRERPARLCSYENGLGIVVLILVH